MIIYKKLHHKKKNLKENCKITKSGYENKMPLKQSD